MTGDRYHIVIVRDGDRLSGLSRRSDGPHGPFSGEWRFMAEDEAGELAAAFNADEREGGTAEVVEVYRFDADPEWTEADA